MPIKIVPKEDKKTSGNEKMRSAAVREEMMDMMRAGEAPKDMKDRLDKVGRESDSEYRRETKDKGMKKGGSVKSSASKRADGIAKKKVKPVEKWSDVFNQQHSVL
jgi:hypothetical protein